MTTKTISLIEQIRASQAICARALENYEQMSDAELARVLGVASDSTVARVNIAVPIVGGLDQLLADAVDRNGIDMSAWHCGTTHCRAGWAVTLAGKAGSALESAVGTEMAGRLIYEASTGRPAPDFFASNKDALDDIKRCAALGQA